MKGEKQMFKIPYKDLASLLKTIRNIIQALKEGDMERALWSLEVLESNISKSLINELRKSA